MDIDALNHQIDGYLVACFIGGLQRFPGRGSHRFMPRQQIRYHRVSCLIIAGFLDSSQLPESRVTGGCYGPDGPDALRNGIDGVGKRGVLLLEHGMKRWKIGSRYIAVMAVSFCRNL